MAAATPHYTLFSGSAGPAEPGRWRFVLRAADGTKRFAAGDIEPDVRGERLELLALVRGLEALDQPSRVTLFTPSRYVRTGLRLGLSEWRRNGWRWECFGHMVPVKNRDLWQRVDRATRFHELECRAVRFDPPHEPIPAAPHATDSCREASCRSRPGPQATAGVLRQPPALPLRRRPKSGRGMFFRSSDRGPHGRSLPESWHNVLGLGKLFSLVKLVRGNRLATMQPAAVCKEV